MTKSELVGKVSEVVGDSKKNAELYLNAIVGVITDELVSGGDVSLTGFGKFSVADVAERKGIVQIGSTKGTEYVTPAHKAPKFKYGSNVKKLVAGE